MTEVKDAVTTALTTPHIEKWFPIVGQVGNTF
jgi:hypothetical protein